METTPTPALRTWDYPEVQCQFTVTGTFSQDPRTAASQLRLLKETFTNNWGPGHDAQFYNCMYPMAYGPPEHLRELSVTIYPSQQSFLASQDVLGNYLIVTDLQEIEEELKGPIPPEKYFPYMTHMVEVMETGASWLTAHTHLGEWSEY